MIETSLIINKSVTLDPVKAHLRNAPEPKSLHRESLGYIHMSNSMSTHIG